MANAYSEVKLNNKTLLSTVKDTVSSETMIKGTTATNSKGEKIEGEANPISKEELETLYKQLKIISNRISELSDNTLNTAYLTNDEESSEIDNEDYIPFYDNSEQEKKNTLLSTIINKLKSAFLPKSWGHVEIVQNGETLRLKDTQVDASASDNGITAIHYPSSNDIVDNDNRILARYEAVVNPNGYIGAKMYARNYDANGNSVGMNTIEAGVDKSGNYSYNVTDSDKFRKAIKTIDQEGTRIPANSDLDDYTTAGTYYVETNTDAGTISNMPLGVAYSGKLIVLDMDSNVRVDQIYITNYNGTGDLVHIYVRQIDNDGVTKPWREMASTDDISPANIGNGYAEATVSGSAITATISGFKLRAGVIVALRIVPNITSACTLNINNTGAKSVKFGSNENVSFGKVIGGARITTFIYDGTYYRVISIDRTPYVGHQNYVADTSGNIFIDWGYGTNRTQIKHNLGSNKLLWNYYKNSAWRGDVVLADYDDLVTQLGIKIPQNANINTYIEQGIFYVESNVDASTMTNLPIFQAGKLIVLRISPNTNYKTQFFTPWNSSKIWSRNTTNGGTNWTSWVEYANTDELGASIAKVGKSILPSWGYTSNVKTHNGITFTFNPSTGEITANGTATANADCVLAGVGVSYYWLGEGAYVLSGCPSGGSSSTYFICLNLDHNDKFDYGSGNSFILTTEYESVNNEHYYIRILSGQTVSNLVFKPMLRPAFTTADFEPCEDIHKGNCYVGTCTTAGGTKDKVAYVDGYFVLRKGVRVAIKFSNNNTYSNVTTSPITLNVNDTGAKNIWYNTTHSGAGNTGTYTTPYGVAKRYNFYIYDGTYWVWDSKGNDDNNTNYLRNDASSTLIASGGAFLDVKSSSIDITQANNGVSETLYPAYIIQDKNGRDMTRLETVVETNGQIRTFLQVCNYNTSTGTHFRNGITMFTDKSQDMWYGIGNPHNFQRELGFGYGTCDTAGSEQIKVVTMPRFRLTVGGIIGVRFTNTNTYSATADNHVQLNVNGTGAKPIYQWQGYPTGTNVGAFGYANRTIFYMYDGTNWVWISQGGDANDTDPRVLGFGYGTCTTAEATTAKEVTLASYILRNGGYVSVKFTNAVPANSTMNINSKGAKNIWYRGANITANVIKAGDLATFIYDGTRYHLVGIDRHCRSTDISSSVTVGCASFSTGHTYVKREGDKCVVNFERTLTADYALIGYNTNILSGLPTVKNGNYWKTAIPMFVIKNSAVTNVIPLQCHRGNPTVLQTEDVNITIPNGSKISFSFEYYCNP